MLLLTTPTATRRALACTLLDRLAEAAPTETGRPGRLVSIEDDERIDYLLGVLDLLALVGVVQLRDDGLSAQVVSAQAGWALRLLSDLLDTGKPLLRDWQSSGLGLAQAPALLAALEARRQELLPGAPPVREVEAAVGLITRAGAGRPKFLLVYDQEAGSWQMPGGRIEHTDASPLDALVRELYEELGVGRLRHPHDLLAHALPTLVQIRSSPTRGLHTRTLFHPFLVTLCGDLDLRSSQVRWFDEQELRAEWTPEGVRMAVEPLLSLLARPELGPLLAS